MGFFTGIGNAARVANEQARLFAAKQAAEKDFKVLNDAGVSKLNGKQYWREGRDYYLQNPADINKQALLNEGKGYAQQQLMSRYGLGTNTAQKVVNAGRNFRDAEINLARIDVNNPNPPFATEKYKNYKQKKQVLDKYVDFYVHGNRQHGVPVKQYDTKAAARDAKARGNKLAQREIEAIKRLEGTTDTLEAIGIANVNRQQNDNYFNVLLENSNYAQEELNQGNQQVAEGYVALENAIKNGQLAAEDLRTVDLGVLKGGLKYDDNPQQPIRMAGDELNRFIGAGSFADVFRDPQRSDVVQKIQPEVSDVRGMLFPNQARQEVEYQLAAAERGIGPRVEYLDLNPDGSTVIGMQNVADNYRSFADVEKELSPEQLAAALIKHNLQLGELNKAGIRMADRHKDNVQLNKMNNRPLQIDFGPEAGAPGVDFGFQGTTTVNNNNGAQAYEIGQRASKAMIAAGLEDEGKLLNDTIMSQLNQGDFEGALDVANQGLSLAGNLKGRVNTKNVLSPAAFYESDGSLSAATSDNLLGGERLYSRFN